MSAFHGVFVSEEFVDFHLNEPTSGDLIYLFPSCHKQSTGYLSLDLVTIFLEYLIEYSSQRHQSQSYLVQGPLWNSLVHNEVCIES